MPVPLRELVSRNNNATNTDLFRNYIKDNFEKIRSECTVITVTGRAAGRYKNNSHALWLEMGLDQRYCMIADYLNGIDGDTDLTLVTTLYLPDTLGLDALARRINR